MSDHNDSENAARIRAFSRDITPGPGEPLPFHLEMARQDSLRRSLFFAEHMSLSEYALELQASREVALRSAQRHGVAALLDGKWYVRRAPNGNAGR